MSINLESTTDSKEAIESALGKKVEPAEEKQTPAPTEETAEETLDASGASEKEEADDDSSEESDDKGDPKAEKKNGFQKRINKLIKQKSEAKAEVEYWRKEAMKQQMVKPQAEKPVETKDQDLVQKPKADDFETHDAYFEALADWKTEQKLATREAKQREDDLKNQYQSQLRTYQERLKDFAKSHGDFDEVVADASDIHPSLTVEQTILDSDVGPALVYALSQDKEEFKRICSLSPLAAARELGKLEAKIKSSDSSKVIEAKTPKAPKPLKPIGSDSTTTSMKSPDEMSLLEYRKWRAAGGGR